MLYLIAVVCLGEWSRRVISSEVGLGQTDIQGANMRHLISLAQVKLASNWHAVCVTRIWDRLHWQLSVRHAVLLVTLGCRHMYLCSSIAYLHPHSIAHNTLPSLCNWMQWDFFSSERRKFDMHSFKVRHSILSTSLGLRVLYPWAGLSDYFCFCSFNFVGFSCSPPEAYVNFLFFYFIFYSIWHVSIWSDRPFSIRQIETESDVYRLLSSRHTWFILRVWPDPVIFFYAHETETLNNQNVW